MGKERDFGLHDQVYRTDKWSRYQWRQFLEGHEPAQATVAEGEKKIYSFPRFSREVFTRLYGFQDVKLDKVRPEDSWAERAHEELDQLPDFQRLVHKCTGDRVVAGEATTTFLKSVMDNIPQPPEGMKDPEQLRQKIQGLTRVKKALEEAKKSTKKVDKAIEALKNEGKQAVEMAAQFSASIDPTNLRNVLREALVTAHEAADEVAESLDTFCGWGTSDGTPQFVSPEIKAKAAEKLRSSHKLQLLAREAGRMRRMAAQKQRSKVHPSRNEITDIECGNDLERLLPSELVKLTNPLMKMDFYRAFYEGALLQYRLRGTETQGRGPIVVCIDSSGSMQGRPEIWAKAIAIALVQIALMQKRWVRVVHFNNAVRAEDDWDPKKLDYMKLMRSMEPFYSGGTSFEAPLRSALGAITKQNHLKKGDVIFITDGEACVSEKFLEEWRRIKKEQQFTCYAVHIGSAGRHCAVLNSFADKVIEGVDFSDDANVTEAVFDI